MPRQGLWKAIFRPIVLFSLLFGTGQCAASPTTKSGNNKVDAVGNAFSKFAYRPRPIARYVTKTSAWKAGRRDILDYGCGGGALSRALAKNGAHRIVAVDLNVNATAKAQRVLEPFPNAVARRPRFTFFGPSGQIGYSSEFDIVVSYCGALSDGSSRVPRIPEGQAMKQAVKACREDGVVISAVKIQTGRYGIALALAVASVVGWKMKAPWLWTMPWLSQYGFWVLVSFPFNQFQPAWILAFSLKNIATSAMLREWRPSSFIHCALYGWMIAYVFWLESRFAEGYKQTMRDAGLQNVKHCRRFSILAYEPIKPSLIGFVKSLLFSLGSAPAMVVLVFEGVKKK